MRTTLVIRVRSLPGNNYFFERKHPSEDTFQPMRDFAIENLDGTTNTVWESDIGVASATEAFITLMQLRRCLGVEIQTPTWTFNMQDGVRQI